jgi:hypothetical protein
VIKNGPLSNENAQGVMRKREREARQLAQKNLREVLETPNGRSFIAAVVFDACGLHDQQRVLDGPLLAYVTGRRNVGLDILDWCREASSVHTRQMITEYETAADVEADVRQHVHAEQDGDDDARGSDDGDTDRVGGTDAD